jgi:hypothetical protein
MSTTTLMILVALVALIIVIAARGRGPSVTHIERRRHVEDRENGE